MSRCCWRPVPIRTRRTTGVHAGWPGLAHLRPTSMHPRWPPCPCLPQPPAAPGQPLCGRCRTRHSETPSPHPACGDAAGGRKSAAGQGMHLGSAGSHRIDQRTNWTGLGRRRSNDAAAPPAPQTGPAHLPRGMQSDPHTTACPSTLRMHAILIPKRRCPISPMHVRDVYLGMD